MTSTASQTQQGRGWRNLGHDRFGRRRDVHRYRVRQLIHNRHKDLIEIRVARLIIIDHPLVLQAAQGVLESIPTVLQVRKHSRQGAPSTARYLRRIAAADRPCEDQSLRLRQGGKQLQRPTTGNGDTGRKSWAAAGTCSAGSGTNDWRRSSAICRSRSEEKRSLRSRR